MANALTLVQTSPPSNPDRMVLKNVVTGNYTSGTADPLPLSNIADPGAIGVITNAGSGTNPPPVTPSIWNAFCLGYYCEVERIVTNGVTTFGLRWFAPGGAELATGAFPAAILDAEIFIEVLVDLFTQS